MQHASTSSMMLLAAPVCVYVLLKATAVGFMDSMVLAVALNSST
jgi:hypothetical protein